MSTVHLRFTLDIKICIDFIFSQASAIFPCMFKDKMTRSRGYVRVFSFPWQQNQKDDEAHTVEMVSEDIHFKIISVNGNMAPCAA